MCKCWRVLLLTTALAVLSGLAVSCTKAKVEKPRCLLPADAELRVGDVVFRRGNGLQSRVVVTVGRGDYSHVGIVADSCGTLLIVHAVPGEPDYSGDPDRVKADTPERFFDRQHACIGEVCRPQDAAVAARAAAVAWQAYRRGVLFDHDYDDSDTTRMYCTELVAYAFSRAGQDLAEGRRHYVNLPFVQTECMFPSDIHASDFLTTIIKF